MNLAKKSFATFFSLILLGTVSSETLADNGSFSLTDPVAEKEANITMVNNQLELSSKIYFKTGTAALRQSSNVIMEDIYRILSANSSVIVEIGGHMDNTGNEKIEKAMSYNRALAVKGWLSRKGIDADRMIVKGYGNSKPIAGPREEFCNELNRRIEIKVVN